MTAPAPQPLYFGPLHSALCGWFHAADSGVAGSPLAVLICPPPGDDDLGSYRGLRGLACALADAGLPSLRFDMAGCGDSSDTDPAANQVTLWLDSLQAAADLLRSRSGAQRLALVGLRASALFAAQAALRRNDVEALVAIVPVNDGRSYLRECRMLSAAAAASSANQPVSTEHTVQAGGYVWNAATCDGLKALSWQALPVACASHALVIERDDLAAGGCAEKLRERGVAVVNDRLPDLQHLTAIAHRAHMPPALIERTVAWLIERAAALPVAFSPSLVPDVPVHDSITVDSVIEQVVCIGQSPRLAGVLSRPSPSLRPAASVPRRGLLLLATGSERRIGAHRLLVPLARQRAARGDVVLRLDRAGIGDSDTRPGGPENDPFDPQAVDDVASALAWLKSEHGIDDCAVVGFCAGAYHGWRAALAGQRLRLMVSVNPVVYHWHAGMSADPRDHSFVQIAIVSDATRSMRDPARWLKLLRGKVHVRVIAGALLARWRATVWRHARHAWRATGASLQNDLGSELRDVAQRGVGLQFLFAPGEPGLMLLQQEAAGMLPRLQQQGRVSIGGIAGADHTFTAEASRTFLYERLHAALDVPMSPVRASHGAAVPARSAAAVAHEA